MLRSVVSMVMWVGRATVFMIGLAVVLALVVGVASTAFARNGDFLKLGTQKNSATRLTALVGKVATGAAFPVRNPSGGTALDLRVDAGQSPMSVNSSTQVANLNADQVVGMRRIIEMLNAPQAVLVVLALFVVIDGSIYYLYREPSISSSTLSARTERAGSMTTSEEETNLVGTGNADQIAGTGGNDIMNGSDGDDTLHGNAGDDILFGEAGDDQLYAGNSSSGGDELSGGNGADYLNADDQEGGDTLRGGDGEDACDGDQGQDTFINCEKRE